LPELQAWLAARATTAGSLPAQGGPEGAT